ncbi:MAG: ABC transporter substrate-binding protein [Candidatus Shapirobacteria bacterium]
MRCVICVLAMLMLIPAVAFAQAEIKSSKDRLIVGLPSDPGNFDPNDNSIQMVHTMRKQIYETLVWRDYDGELKPQLAESWEYENPTTIILHIRKGVQFHRGYGELKASDVLFSLKRVAKVPAALSAVSQIDFEKSAVIDPYTVKIVTKGVYVPQMAYFEWALTGIFSEKAFTESGGDFSKNPVGTGAYQLVKHVSGDSYEFEAFKDYWDKGKPYVKYLTMRVITEAANRTIELETGGVDLIYEAPAADINRLSQNKNLTVYRDPSVNTNYIFMRTDREYTKNKLVRQAIAYAVDRATAVKTAYKGTGVTAVGYCSPGVEGFDGNVKPYEFNLAKAKKLMTDAGYANGFTLTFIVDTTPERMDIVEVFQNQLKQINITCKVKVIEPIAYQSAFKEGNFDLMVYGLTTTTAEGDKAFRWFHSGHALGQTFTAWKSPAYDALIDEAAGTIDKTKRLQLYSKAQQMLKEECILITTLHREILTAATAKLKGFNNNITFESPYLKGVYFVK